MPNNYCQTFQQRIKELKGKAQNIEALLSEYKNTTDEQIAEKIEENLREIEGFIEEFKQEFKTKATQLIEEFIQRIYNENEKIEIIFDEKDCRFIIDGNLDFISSTNPNDLPNLIKKTMGCFFNVFNAQTLNLPNLKEIGRHFDALNIQTINLFNLEKVGEYFDARNAQTINLPNLKEVGGSFRAIDAQTINLPNLEKIGRDFYAPNAQTINLPNLKEIGGDIYFNKNNSNLNSLVELAREWRKKGILKGKIKISNKEGNVFQEF